MLPFCKDYVHLAAHRKVEGLVSFSFSELVRSGIKYKPLPLFSRVSAAYRRVENASLFTVGVLQ